MTGYISTDIRFDSIIRTGNQEQPEIWIRAHSSSNSILSSWLCQNNMRQKPGISVSWNYSTYFKNFCCNFKSNFCTTSQNISMTGWFCHIQATSTNYKNYKEKQNLDWIYVKKYREISLAYTEMALHVLNCGYLSRISNNLGEEHIELEESCWEIKKRGFSWNKASLQDNKYIATCASWNITHLIIATSIMCILSQIIECHSISHCLPVE